MKIMKFYFTILTVLVLFVANNSFGENKHLIIDKLRVGMVKDDACNIIAEIYKVPLYSVAKGNNTCRYEDHFVVWHEDTGKVFGVTIDRKALGLYSNFDTFLTSFRKLYAVTLDKDDRIVENEPDFKNGYVGVYGEDLVSIIEMKNNQDIIMILDKNINEREIDSNNNKSEPVAINKPELKPFPMSVNNIDILIDKLNTKFKNLESSPSIDKFEAVMRIYETVIEKEMGYSLDKTVRSMFLFNDYIDINFKNLVLNVMEPLIDFIRENPKAALEKKLISDRTYSIVTMKATSLTDEQIQFLNFIIECQKLNNGLCSNLELLKLIVAKDGIRYDVYNHKNYSTAAARLSYDLQNKYNYLDLGLSKKMIVSLKGEPINANGMLDPVFRDSYLKVDEERYRSSLKMIEIKREEKQILFN